MLVDSHCHLDFPDFAKDFDGMLARAREAGIGAMVTICTHLSRFSRVLAIAEAHEDIWCSVGVHPHEADGEGVASPEPLIERARQHDRVVGIGETGLDYYYEHSPREAQQRSFRAHIEAARETGLPVIVHTRDADDETAAMLRESSAAGQFPGLIHCFSTTRKVSDAALECGMCISISGIATFRKAEPLREIIRDIPLDRLLVETDAPFLAPVPRRGKRNEPAFVVDTAACIAEIKGVSIDEISRITTDNFFRLFSRARRPDRCTT